MGHVNGKPVVVLGRKLKAKKEFRLFKLGPNPSTKGTYQLTRDSAMRLMAIYRDRGLKITFDYDHCAIQKDVRPGDGIAAGKCDLELRNDGIYCVNVEYTPAALKAIEDGEWVYFSPAFLPNEETKEIEELINVALTNIPALDGIEALAASRLVACVIKHEGSKWNLYDSSGKKLLGSHDSEEEAKKQESAINISKGREAGHHIPKPKESTAMKHPISAFLQKHTSGGGKLDDVAKGTGIHVDRLKELHDGMGDAPAGEELTAMAKHFKFGPDQMKEMSVPEPYKGTGGETETASAMDGQDVEHMDGEGDDDDDAPVEQRRGLEAIKLMALLTGTSDPKKQRAKILAMRSKSEAYDADHETVVALKAEREADRRKALIQRGKDEGKLTPSSLKFWSNRPCDELEEFLKVAPRVLATKPGEHHEMEGSQIETLTRQDLEAARLFGVTPENFAKAKTAAIVEASGSINDGIAIGLERQKQAVTQSYVDLDAEGYKRPARGVRHE